MMRDHLLFLIWVWTSACPQLSSERWYSRFPPCDWYISPIYLSISSEEIHEVKVKMKVTWYMMDSEMSVCSPLQKFFFGTHRGGKTENKYLTVEMLPMLVRFLLEEIWAVAGTLVLLPWSPWQRRSRTGPNHWLLAPPPLQVPWVRSVRFAAATNRSNRAHLSKLLW